MFVKQFLSCFLFAILLSSCGGSKSSTSSSASHAVNFQKGDQLMPILEKAKRDKKLVFVDVYTSWCLPCKMMDRDVFSDPALGNFLNKNFVSLKVDAEKGNGGNLATIFNVYAYPTLLFLDENGNVLERKEGAAYQTEMRAMAERAMAKASGTAAR